MFEINDLVERHIKVNGIDYRTRYTVTGFGWSKFSSPEIDPPDYYSLARDHGRFVCDGYESELTLITRASDRIQEDIDKDVKKC